MREKLWNFFLETGSVDAFLDYRNYMTLGGFGDRGSYWI
jgi:hypothetical protein